MGRLKMFNPDGSNGSGATPSIAGSSRNPLKIVLCHVDAVDRYRGMTEPGNRRIRPGIVTKSFETVTKLVSLLTFAKFN